MIQINEKVWIVDKGSLFDMPAVKVGMVLESLPNSRYVIRQENGIETVLPSSEIFVSCRDANRHQMEVLNRRLSFIKPRMERMEHVLANMIA